MSLDSPCSLTVLPSRVRARLSKSCVPLVVGKTTFRPQERSLGRASGRFFPSTMNRSVVNRLLCGLLRPFHRTVKSGVTPDSRAAWNLQMRLKSAPECVTRCKVWLKLGTQETERLINRPLRDLATIARKGLFENLGNSLKTTD
jgi:hypothetical protein